MKNLFSLKNMVKTVAIFAVGMGLVSCQKDENGVGAANVQKEQASLVITKKDSLWENSWVTVDTTVINLWWKYLRNDTVIQKDSTKTNFGATISVDKEKVETNATRLANLVITEGQITPSRDGKNNYQFRQTMTDNDGQTYPGLFKSGYAALKDLKDVHAKLIGFKSTGFRNIPQVTPEDYDTLVITRVGWKAIYEIENGKNLAGQQFEIALDSTDHFRYIPKGAPQIVDRKPFQYKDLGIWKSTWTFGFHYYWDNGTVTGDSMQVVLNGSYETIELKDKVVGNLADYSHADGTLKFKERTAAQSNDTRVKKFNNRYEKESYATNGISADEFRTLFVITVQDATAEFCDTTWTFKADEVAMTTTRNVFVDEDSDRDGYSMVRFTDTESAKYADGKGDNTVALKESCKLYLKVKDPELIDVIFSNASKKHTASPNKVKVTLKGKEKYDTGAESEDIDFGFEMDEIWEAVDTFYSKQTEYIYETTDTMRADGSVVKTAQTKTVKGGTWSFNKYEGYTFVPVKIDGKEFKVRWHFVVYEDFSFTYKKYSYNKFDAASYSYKAENDKLAQNTDLTTASLEVWNYTVDGIFTIEDATRTAEGTGRLDKAIEEKVIRTYWDEASKGQSHTILASTRWATLIREYNTGKKTTQEYKHVFNRLSGTSKWEITAEEGSEAANGSMILENANEENRADDFAHFTLKKFELGQFFNVPGAAQQHDKVTFTESMGAYFEVKDQDGNPIKVYFEDPSYSFTNNVKALTVKSENDSETVYQHENVVNWSFGGATTTLSATGLIHVAKSQETPDYDIEVGKIYSTVSRPSNRNGVNGDITAYTYLLVSKDGKKCLPLGIYHDVITVGEITDMESGFNSACYEKDQNKVVATRCELVDGIIQYYRHATGYDAVDAGMFMKWQAAGFNNRGNSYENWQHKYEPKAEKKNGVTVVRFGTEKAYTFLGWNV